MKKDSILTSFYLIKILDKYIWDKIKDYLKKSQINDEISFELSNGILWDISWRFMTTLEGQKEAKPPIYHPCD